MKGPNTQSNTKPSQYDIGTLRRDFAETAEFLTDEITKIKKHLGIETEKPPTRR